MVQSIQKQPHAEPQSAAKVDGWDINIPDLETAVCEIVAAAKTRESFSAVTLNVDHLVKLRRNAAFRDAYRAARFVTADGAPVAWLARRANPAIVRTTGADLVVPLAQAAAQAKVPVYLFGTTDDVLARAGQHLVHASGGDLDICGTAAPSGQFDPNGAEADAALEAIAASGTRLCLLALGAPKQEILAARAVKRGIPVGFVSIGAALDFLTGAQVRAPKILQDHGLEWSWRLLTNPLRLGPRYASCALVLADILVRDFGLSRRSWISGAPS